MPPRAVTFPLAPSHRDACLRCMHLPAKPNRLLVQRMYGLLFNKLTKNAPEGTSDENKEPLALGCAFLLVVLWKCFEEKERQLHDNEEQDEQMSKEQATNKTKVNGAAPKDGPSTAALYTASDDPYFLLRQVTSDYARLVRLLSNASQPNQQPPPPSLLVAAKTLLTQYLETCEKIPKWMQIAASNLTTSAASATTTANPAAAVESKSIDDADEEDEDDDEEMDEDEENDAVVEKKVGKAKATSNATAPLLQFLRRVLEGLVENTTVLLASYCLDFGPLWDRTACNFLETSVWTRRMQHLVLLNDDESSAGMEIEPPLFMLGEHAIQNDAQVMMQLQKYAWKLACYRAYTLHSEATPGHGLPTRQERLLASCGAMAFILALNRMMLDSIDEGMSDEEPASKKLKKEFLLETIRDAALEARNFSRWTPDGSDVNKIGAELKAEELQNEVTAVAEAVYAAVASEPPLGDKSTILQSSCDDPRIQQLSEMMPVGVDARKVLFYLPSAADMLFNSTLESLKHGDFDPKSIAYVDEGELVDLSSLDAIVDGAQEFHTFDSGRGRVASPSGPNARRVVTPPVLTSNMELNEWTVSLLYLETVKPSNQLVQFLELGSEGSSKKWTTTILPTINRALLRLSQENMIEKTSRVAPVSVDVQTGLVEVAGESSPDKQLCTAVVALYYHALEAILYCESIRLAYRKHQRLIFDTTFHRSLLACCMMCIIKAVGVTQKIRPATNVQSLQIFGVLPIAEISAYDFLKVSESFIRALTSSTARGKLESPLIFALPKVLVKDIRRTEIMIIDSLLWTRDKKSPESMVDKIEDFQEKTEKKGNVCLWPPQVLMPAPHEPEEFDFVDVADRRYPRPDDEDYADYRCVSYLLRRVLKVADDRIQSLCNFLGIPRHLPIAHQVWVAFRYLLRGHIYLLYDRHIDHWILCCLYGVCRALKYDPQLTFARIIDAYVVIRGPESGDVTCQRIVRHIKIIDSAPQPIGDIIYLYNQIFLWKIHKHLIRSKSIQLAAQELANIQGQEDVQVTLTSPNPHLNRMQANIRGHSDRPATQTMIKIGSPLPSNTEQADAGAGDNGVTGVPIAMDIGVPTAPVEVGEVAATPDAMQAEK